jgi:hypothetical protein
MHESPLDPNRTYLLKHTTQIMRAEIQAVRWRKDMDTLEEAPARSLELNDIGRVTLSTHRPLYVDAYRDNRDTGSFILIDTISNNTVAAGMIIAMDAPLGDGGPPVPAAGWQRAGDGQPVPAAGWQRTGDDGGQSASAAGSRRAALSQVSARERRARFGVAPGIIVLVGATHEEVELLAYAVERRLFDFGASGVVVGPGDGMREAVSIARAVADAGLLAILAIPAAGRHAVSLDPTDWAAQALVVQVTAGQSSPTPRDSDPGTPIHLRTLPTLELDSTAASRERSADAVVAALRDRGWMG